MSKSFQTIQRTLGALNYLEVNLIRSSARQLRDNLGNLDDLCESIKQNGLLQPIIVRPTSDSFEVVAGNRRLAACKLLHISKILCFIKDIPDKDAYEISITENVQRKTLDAVEQARAFKKYVDEFGYGSVSELARQIGRSEEYVSHSILLLTLPHEVIEKVRNKELSPTLAQEIIWVRDPDQRVRIAEEAIRRGLTQNKLRRIVKLVKNRGGNLDEAIESVRDSPRESFKIHHDDGDNKAVKALTEASLILKSTLIQLDSLLDRSASDPEIERFLIKERYSVHQLLDEIVVFRKRRMKNPKAVVMP